MCKSKKDEDRQDLLIRSSQRGGSGVPLALLGLRLLSLPTDKIQFDRYLECLRRAIFCAGNPLTLFELLSDGCPDFGGSLGAKICIVVAVPEFEILYIAKSCYTERRVTYKLLANLQSQRHKVNAVAEHRLNLFAKGSISVADDERRAHIVLREDSRNHRNEGKCEYQPLHNQSF